MGSCSANMKGLKETIRAALTKKTVKRKGRRKELMIEEVPPSERLVLFVQFVMVTIAALTTLELAHLIILGTWNNEIFAAITGLVGTITGLLLGAKTQ
ncbi:hypothetical protein B6U79_03860 [Candidatus Bathyarchaeota archaeon ex4484_231]|nr:MAG: hypothetical protein B6U79_03860 [Candidatus Bathyarchaeota archaeon ex4484_231]